MKKRLFEIEYLARACSHHDSYENLLERCFTLTIFIRSLDYAETVSKVAFLKINQILYGHRSARGPKRSSLILSGDVEGSRQRRPNFQNPEVPHMHGLLVLSPEDYQTWQHTMPRLMTECRDAIMKIGEVGQGSMDGGRPARKCHVTLKPLTGSAERWLSYGTKAFEQAFLRGEDFDAPYILPWDIEIRHGGDKANNLEKRMRAVRAALRPEFFDQNGRRRLIHAN